MNMIGIKCPHCGADLKINDEIDMFYCNFCGGQIFMDGAMLHMIQEPR